VLGFVLKFKSNEKLQAILLSEKFYLHLIIPNKLKINTQIYKGKYLVQFAGEMYQLVCGCSLHTDR
jgi:hypothetical protein